MKDFAKLTGTCRYEHTCEARLIGSFPERSERRLPGGERDHGADTARSEACPKLLPDRNEPRRRQDRDRGDRSGAPEADMTSRSR